MKDYKIMLDELRADNAKTQKKGLHFIMASVFVWIAVTIITAYDIPILQKNLFVFCITPLLLPLAFLFSKIIHIDFSSKDNPLNALGILFAMNQFLYLPIVMWVYPAVPGKMVMVLAMVFGAHLLPFGWIYNSKSYTVLAFIIPFLSLYIGCVFVPIVLPITMIIIESIFCILLSFENKKGTVVSII